MALGHIGPAYNGEAIVCSRHGRSPCRRELILGLRSKPRMSEPRASEAGPLKKIYLKYVYNLALNGQIIDL